MDFDNMSKLFKIGKTEIKNRFAVAPMDTGGLYEDQYSGISKDGIEYFVRRAQGGFGLLFSWGMRVDSKVDHLGSTILDNPSEFIKTGQELNRRLYSYGTKMFTQLAFGLGRNMPGCHTPSPLPTLGNPDLISPQITAEQIKEKISQMIEGAKIAKLGGYAGVEIHALHWGHLLDEFALSIMNHRKDEYGDSLTDRLRIAKDLIEGIKKECGEDFPVSIRLGVRSFLKDFGKACFTDDEAEEKGRKMEESIEIAKLLESYGYDCLNLDTGVLDAFYWCCPPSYIQQGYMVKFAEAIKKNVNIPILVGSRMQNPETAENGIKEGLFDAVVLGRPSFADPDIPNKIITNHPERIRPCIGCNQCIQRYFSVGAVGCTVNPEMGRDITYRLQPSIIKKKVIIVGGGVAGMEAARISKLRGHEVMLFEKTDRLGGNLIPSGAHDFKIEVKELNEWYRKELGNLNVDIRLNTQATPELISSLNPDAIILAQGSVPVSPKIPGIDNPKVLNSIEALQEGVTTGESVVVIGGGLVGCEMALGYLKEGKRVTLIEAMDDILTTPDIPMAHKQYLKDAFEYYNAEVLCSTKVVEISDQGVTVTLSNGEKAVIEADNIIMAVGFRSLPSLKEELLSSSAEIYEVGDGNKVGNILTAIWQAYEVAHNL